MSGGCETQTEGELVCDGEVIVGVLDGGGVVEPIYDFFEDVSVAADRVKRHFQWDLQFPRDPRFPPTPRTNHERELRRVVPGLRVLPFDTLHKEMLPPPIHLLIPPQTKRRHPPDIDHELPFRVRVSAAHGLDLIGDELGRGAGDDGQSDGLHEPRGGVGRGVEDALEVDRAWFFEADVGDALGFLERGLVVVVVVV